MQGADAIAEILRREGTEFLAVYPAQPLVDAAAKAGIRPIICRQERVGMAIADGFSRVANGKRIGVFAMQQGPGSENAFPGAAQAFSDNTPILLLPGGEFKSKAFSAPNFSPYDNYAHVTKWRAQFNMVERIPDLMRRAFYLLRTGKGGPVLLETPRDVWTEELPGQLDYKPVFGNKTAPPPGAVREIADVLLSAERPVIYAGQGCLYAEAWDELQECAELLQAPVTTTMAGKSAFPEDHPLSLGASAVSHTKGTWHFLEKADLVFAVGTSLTRTAYGKSIPPGKTIVHSTVDSSDVNKDYQSDYSILGDAKLTLRGLAEEIKRRTNGVGHKNTRDAAPEVARIRREWLDEWIPQLTSDETPINQYRIIRDLQDNVDAANTIITHDAGSPRDQLVPMWQCTAPRTYIGWGKSTQLGFGLGAIMGAKLAEPEKLCINIMGDAAIGMVGMDIETAVRNQIGILTIVFNNQIMAIERSHQPYSAESHDSLAHGGDYRMVAEGLGAWSKKVQRPDEFVPVLEQAVAVTKTGRPAVLDCVVKEGYDFSKYE